MDGSLINKNLELEFLSEKEAQDQGWIARQLPTTEEGRQDADRDKGPSDWRALIYRGERYQHLR